MLYKYGRPKGKRIVRNQARCRKCGETLISLRDHPIRCKCGALEVSGGAHYIGRGWRSRGYDELSEYTDDLRPVDGWLAITPR